ncbi:hypothetical protein CJ030_MR2G006846 [Morella rubra]|uniref:Uncharacterized protein n=1 Tax=Morella rubra TaxID=262757 RepID=A0A6A1WD13_9ROSI|nr:hypothetical protein CJ030_MR2G006846 [Morella rubra]
MALPATHAVIPPTKHSSREAYGIYNRVEMDVHVSVEHPWEFEIPTPEKGFQEEDELHDGVEVDTDIHPDLLPYDFDFLPVEKPKLLVQSDSPQKEKQISVDPISLKGSSMRKSSLGQMLLPPLLQPARTKFLSCSLPNSASSSPRFSSKKKLRDAAKAFTSKVSNLALQQSAAEDYLTSQQEIRLRRSKSCCEGRTRVSTDDLDLWLTKQDVSEYDNRYYANFFNTEATRDVNRNARSSDASDKEFKCGACLFLPGFSKGKQVRARKEEAESQYAISKRASLEKFECGSWASAAGTQDSEGDSKNLYFDLPLELIRTSVSDEHSPVTAAFIFDNDPKGILKNRSMRATAKKLDESPRHVRFSTSTPASHTVSPASCITPRLRKAREDFNTLLEAQGV